MKFGCLPVASYSRLVSQKSESQFLQTISMSECETRTKKTWGGSHILIYSQFSLVKKRRITNIFEKRNWCKDVQFQYIMRCFMNLISVPKFWIYLRPLYSLSRNMKAHKHAHYSLLLDPNLRHLNPLQNFTLYFFKNHFNIIILLVPSAVIAQSV
jgi:hypothetical protein